jgi:hypothetical protein
MDDEARDQRIREIAHRMWEEEGRPHDQSERHWEMARQVIEEEEQERRRGAAGADTPRKSATTKPA